MASEKHNPEGTSISAAAHIYDEDQTLLKPRYTANIEAEECAASSPRNTPAAAGETDFDVPEIHIKSDEYYVRLLERRLSCQEVQSWLDTLNTLRETPVDLPENKGSVLECRLHKHLGKQDAIKTIDDVVNKTKVWLEQLGEAMKRHVTSHRFSVDYDRDELLRERDAETDKKRADSGICSQEIPPHEINSLKADLHTEGADQACKSDDEGSWDCNVCECSYESCRCNPLSGEEVRRKPRQESKRMAIVSFSQIPQDLTNLNHEAKIRKDIEKSHISDDTLQSQSAQFCSTGLKVVNNIFEQVTTTEQTDSQTSPALDVGNTDLLPDFAKRGGRHMVHTYPKTKTILGELGNSETCKGTEKNAAPSSPLELEGSAHSDELETHAASSTKILQHCTQTENLSTSPIFKQPEIPRTTESIPQSEEPKTPPPATQLENLKPPVSSAQFDELGIPLSPGQLEKRQSISSFIQFNKPKTAHSAAQIEQHPRIPLAAELEELNNSPCASMLEECQTPPSAIQPEDPKSLQSATQLDDPKTPPSASQHEDPKTHPSATQPGDPKKHPSATQPEDPKTHPSATQPGDPKKHPSATQSEDPKMPPSATQPEDPKMPPSATQPGDPKKHPSATQPEDPKTHPSATQPGDPKKHPSATQSEDPKMPPSATQPEDPKMPPSATQPEDPKKHPSATQPGDPKKHPSATQSEDPKMPPSATQPEDPKMPPSATQPGDPKKHPSATQPEDPKTHPSATQPGDPKKHPSATQPEDPKMPPSATQPEDPKTPPSATQPEDPKKTPSA